MRYFAIEGTGLSMKGAWMQNLLRGKAPAELEEFAGRKGLLHSTVSLEKFIEDEFQHDNFALSTEKKRSIRTFSSGEQRKALLTYLISKSPGFLVVDNPFDCLDSESVAQLKAQITELAKHIPVVQIFKRSGDLLPFISHVLLIEEDQLRHVHKLEEYLQLHIHKETGSIQGSIPPPSKEFNDIPEILVELKDVAVNYGDRPVLRQINWQIKRGEFWQLTGPNGSGKTTLLTMIYGDNPKAYGVELYLFGKKKGSGESVWDIKKKIGYFTPSITELFHRNNTVEQMVISGLLDTIGLYRKATGHQQEIADAWLRALGITELRNESFQRLSQIHQRLVLIARAMIKHPPLLILDEPSTGLDDSSAAMLSELINAIAAESRTAILYVSHRQEKGLRPQRIFRLTPGDSGSEGRDMPADFQTNT
ncbi:MAG: ATP-binding cassette domain-containing protein [Bacteroidales bacterium]|nr:ATP-binding cassette domain-containing protein [Bacteroidales bacterium]